MKVCKASLALLMLLSVALPCSNVASQPLESNPARASIAQLTDDDLKSLRAQLLHLVNLERSIAKLSPLKLDDLASEAAQKHALDMVNKKFLSHCGSDGSNPFHRYSFAGGIHALTENVSSFENVRTTNPVDLGKDLSFMHMKMHAEVPPDDGHRRNILGPNHTHVGFGIAMAGNQLRLAEEYIGKYVEVSPFQQHASRGAEVVLTGRLLDRNHVLRSIDIFYEPLPKPLDINELIEARSCGLPNVFVTIRPKLNDDSVYIDGTKGSIEIGRGGQFRAPIKLFKDAPGIYTVLFWVSRTRLQKPFAATNICIKSD